MVMREGIEVIFEGRCVMIKGILGYECEVRVRCGDVRKVENACSSPPSGLKTSYATCVFGFYITVCHGSVHTPFATKREKGK